jgi:hypothetical protein
MTSGTEYGEEYECSVNTVYLMLVLVYFRNRQNNVATQNA